MKTNYYTAVNWLGNSYVLMNNINEFVDDIIEIESLTADYVDEDTLLYKEVFQIYASDCNEDEVDWLMNHMGLRFAYSEKLDTYFLLVDHLGTAWKYVTWETDIENAACELGEFPKAF